MTDILTAAEKVALKRFRKKHPEHLWMALLVDGLVERVKAATRSDTEDILTEEQWELVENPMAKPLRPIIDWLFSCLRASEGTVSRLTAALAESEARA